MLKQFIFAILASFLSRAGECLQAVPSVLCVSLCIMFASQSGWAFPATSFFQLHFDLASKKQRSLTFGNEFSLGELLISPLPEQIENRAVSVRAKGHVQIPAARFVTFAPSPKFYLHPEAVKTIPVDAFDSVVLSARAMDESDEGFPDRAMVFIGKLNGLVQLNLDRSDISDKGADNARDLVNLQSFSAFLTSIEGKCFEHFGKLKNLRLMYLDCCPIKDSNLAYLSTLPHLECLELSRTGISDLGVSKIANCRQLILLELASNPRITDKSIPSLLMLKHLRRLGLGESSITFDGLLKLKSLNLAELQLPSNLYSEGQMSSLHKAFPGTKFMLATPPRRVDPLINRLYAPLR